MAMMSSPVLKRGKKGVWSSQIITTKLTQIAECGAGNDGPGSSATEDENDEHSQILETLKDDNANDNHSV